MQTNDPDYLFQTTSELNSAEHRERKVKAAENVGSPIKVSSKVLDVIVDGQIAWTAESGWQARKLNLETGKTTMLYKGHKGPVTSVQIYKVGGEAPWLAVITSSWDKSIRIWDSKTGECRFTLQGHQDFVKSTAVLPTSPATLISTSSDKTCRVWDLSALDENKEPPTIQTIKDHTRPVDAAAYWLSEAPGPKQFTVWTSDSLGTIKEWRMDLIPNKSTKPMTFVRDLGSHETSVGRLHSTEDGLWSVSMDKTARFHDLEGGSPVSLSHPSYVKTVLPQPFGLPYILTGSEDEEIRVWDATNLETAKSRPISVVSGHCGEVTAMALWSKAVNGQPVPHVITASLDGTLRRWTIKDLLNPPQLNFDPVRKQGDISMTEEEERELAELMSDDD